MARFPGGRGKGRAFIERHGDVGIEQPLDLDCALGCEPMPAAVEMRLEDHAVLVDGAQLGEGEHLEASRIGEDRAGPVHEPVQPAERGDALRARPQHQVIGVGKDHGESGARHVFGAHRLDGRRGADGHEGGRVDRAVRRREPAAPCRAVARRNGEFGAHGASGNSRQASP